MGKIYDVSDNVLLSDLLDEMIEEIHDYVENPTIDFDTFAEAFIEVYGLAEADCPYGHPDSINKNSYEDALQIIVDDYIDDLDGDAELVSDLDRSKIIDQLQNTDAFNNLRKDFAKELVECWVDSYREYVSYMNIT